MWVWEFTRFGGSVSSKLNWKLATVIFPQTLCGGIQYIWVGNEVSMDIKSPGSYPLVSVFRSHPTFRIIKWDAGIVQSKVPASDIILIYMSISEAHNNIPEHTIIQTNLEKNKGCVAVWTESSSREQFCMIVFWTLIFWTAYIHHSSQFVREPLAYILTCTPAKKDCYI